MYRYAYLVSEWVLELTEDSIFLLQASDETLHLVLETVQAAVKAGELLLDLSKAYGNLFSKDMEWSL